MFSQRPKLKWTKLFVDDPEIVSTTIGAHSLQERDEVLRQVREKYPEMNARLAV